MSPSWTLTPWVFEFIKIVAAWISTPGSRWTAQAESYGPVGFRSICSRATPLVPSASCAMTKTAAATLQMPSAASQTRVCFQALWPSMPNPLSTWTASAMKIKSRYLMRELVAASFSLNVAVITILATKPSYGRNLTLDAIAFHGIDLHV
jgi:hypothetical protein